MSYCKYQRCVEMKVLDNSFSRIVHISGEILKFTLCTDIYSTVNKNVGFFFNFLLKKKKSYLQKEYGTWCLESLFL